MFIIYSILTDVINIEEHFFIYLYLFIYYEAKRDVSSSVFCKYTVVFTLALCNELF